MITAPVRPVRVLGAEALFDRRPDGTIYVKSPRELGSYPVKLTERLDYWATQTPNQIFLAQRDAVNAWRKVTYSQSLHQVRSIAQSLLNRRLSGPVVIISGNSIEHGLLALACMYAGITYTPVSPSYALASSELTTLRYLWRTLEPAMVFAQDGAAFEKPLTAILEEHCELVTVKPPQLLRSTSFAELCSSAITGVDAAHARVTADTIAKILFTSGSTGSPKGVITTHRMLCANQEMLRTTMGFLAEEPPLLCDWLPWNHVFGGSHNFGIVLYNGGTMYLDDGKPTTNGFGATIANLKEIATTAYFNVPKGYEMLVPALRADAELRQTFFRRLKLLFYAAAGLNQKLWDELQDLAVDTCGESILMMTGLGATESAPFALSTGIEGASAGRLGLPVPGVELKVVPYENKLEARLRGPNITPGFWRAPEQTAAAFDEEGFYKLGDAVLFVDPDQPLKGFQFDGRLSEDFKLSTGTWVSVGPLRAKFLTHFLGVVQEVVLTAPDRDYVGALVFPAPGATEESVGDRLSAFARQSTGNSTCVKRVLMMDKPPSMDAGELTDKGTINQKSVLKNRASFVEELYAGSARVIEIQL